MKTDYVECDRLTFCSPARGRKGRTQAKISEYQIMIPFEGHVSIPFLTHIQKTPSKSTTRCFLPVSRKSTELMVHPLLVDDESMIFGDIVIITKTMPFYHMSELGVAKPHLGMHITHYHHYITLRKPL